MISVKLLINQEHNGLELHFSEKPDRSVLAALTNARWHYHRVKKCWYAKHNDTNMAFAQKLLGSDLPTTPSQLNESTAFFPAYDTVDGIPVCHSSEVSCWEQDEGYFQDINAYIEVRVQRIVIIDLTDALLPGKACKKIVFQPKDEYSPYVMHAGLDTFRAVYDTFFVRGEKPEMDCHIWQSDLKSTRVFSPFRKIKPIQAPEKWTLPHVWKAILSGQIYMGQCDGRYTDDYAYDAAVDFRSGMELHLPSFAKELIEEPSGWHVYPSNKGKDGLVQLSVNCHSFNMNTLHYDEACNWADNIHRQKQREQERMQHNADLESRQLSSQEVKKLIGDHQLIDVEYLIENNNTDRYEVESKLMLRKNLFHLDKLSYPVIAVVPHPIDDAALFEINCTSELESDTRIIMTSDSSVVSGKALKELLIQSTTSDLIREVCVLHQNWQQLKEELTNWRDGRIMRLLSPIPKERFVKSLARLEKEKDRCLNTPPQGGDVFARP